MKKITVVTGHYGSGKTNLSVNLAVKARSNASKNTAVVDLDIVNPYFRAADFRELFERSGITFIAPDFANTNLDLPSLQFDLARLAKNYDNLIVDVGGDDAGAFALGRFSGELNANDDVEMLYVINQRRFLTQTAEEAVELMYEIESASRMKHTAIVNNTNLGSETTAEIIEQSEEFAREISEKTGLPIKFTACPEMLCGQLKVENILPIKIYVKPIWDK
ncbi:MAG: cobalamin biosynthesis protein CobQ [Oscillospiraceae bacterium]|nr:cobalamin biosynthesis protein CobQ [Oscillospiraceae bacterium]